MSFISDFQQQPRRQRPPRLQHPVQPYFIGLGKFYFIFNFILFGFCFLILDTDLIIASLILVFVSSAAVDYCLSMFNQQKLALIISNQADGIAEDVMSRMRIGATFLAGRGACKNEEPKEKTTQKCTSERFMNNSQAFRTSFRRL